jgi:hypothetical protein
MSGIVVLTMKINLNQNKNLKLFKIFLKSQKEIISLYILLVAMFGIFDERKASTDIDFVTEQSGIELAQNVGKKLIRK